MSTRLREGISAVLCGVAFLLSTGLGNATESTVEGDLPIDAKSFRCITKMTQVRQFYVDHLRGNLIASLAADNSTTGAVYTQRSDINLYPCAAMDKHDMDILIAA